MGWFLLGGVLGFLVCAACMVTILERLYPEVTEEFANGTTSKKYHQWKIDHADEEE